VHVDHLARPIKMTDAAKAQAWDAVWAPWGSPHAITGPAALDARFPGQWFQLEAGLHYNWHRHYDASLGRYTQPDPLGFVDGPSVYGYAAHDPLGYVDPDGQFIRPLIDLLRRLGRNVHFEGPGKDYTLYGHGRICQVRYKDWFLRLDFDPVPGGRDPIYHLNVGSSRKGKPNYHIPLNPTRWF
jgi:RHS repeat-associated protein